MPATTYAHNGCNSLFSPRPSRITSKLRQGDPEMCILVLNKIQTVLLVIYGTISKVTNRAKNYFLLQRSLMYLYPKTTWFRLLTSLDFM